MGQMLQDQQGALRFLWRRCLCPGSRCERQSDCDKCNGADVHKTLMCAGLKPCSTFLCVPGWSPALLSDCDLAFRELAHLIDDFCVRPHERLDADGRNP